MTRYVVQTTNAPAAVGPYSQAISEGGFVFCSGQVALDPATGDMVGSTAAEQTHQCMANLTAVLEAAGSSLVHVVKFTVYLVDMNDFAEFNEVFAGYLGPEPPARATVGVVALPKGARVEIDCIARA